MYFFFLSSPFRNWKRKKKAFYIEDSPLFLSIAVKCIYGDMRQHKDSSVIHQKAPLKHNYITELHSVISFVFSDNVLHVKSFDGNYL